MTTDMFITGEWGSVAMRLHLCARTGDRIATIDTVRGGGVRDCTDFEAAFFAAAGPWFQTHGPLPVILAGMIGSNIGWRDSGYAPCPAGTAELTGQLTSFTVRGVTINLSPGLKCRNMFGLPDVVRGEEMQVFGWLNASPCEDDERRLVCLPGRHVKWMVTRGQQIVSFFTGMNGEMEDILLAHSLLGRGVVREGFSQPDFDVGLTAVRDDTTLSLGHALFATRSRLVLGDHDAGGAASFLSGLLVGADIRDALNACRSRGLLESPVVVMGAGQAATLYADGLAAFGQTMTAISDDALAIHGLAALLERQTAFHGM